VPTVGDDQLYVCSARELVHLKVDSYQLLWVPDNTWAEEPKHFLLLLPSEVLARIVGQCMDHAAILVGSAHAVRGVVLVPLQELALGAAKKLAEMAEQARHPYQGPASLYTPPVLQLRSGHLKASKQLAKILRLLQFATCRSEQYRSVALTLMVRDPNPNGP
jgi:hypothetical protein